MSPVASTVSHNLLQWCSPPLQVLEKYQSCVQSSSFSTSITWTPFVFIWGRWLIATVLLITLLFKFQINLIKKIYSYLSDCFLSFGFPVWSSSCFSMVSNSVITTVVQSFSCCLRWANQPLNLSFLLSTFHLPDSHLMRFTFSPLLQHGHSERLIQASTCFIFPITSA